MSLRDAREALAEVIRRRDAEQAQERAALAKHEHEYAGAKQLRSTIEETIQNYNAAGLQVPGVKSAVGLADRVKKLLQDGVDPNLRPGGTSPLDLLVKHPDRQEAMQAMIPLLKAGADPKRDDILGSLMRYPLGLLHENEIVNGVQSQPTKGQLWQAEPSAELVGMLVEAGSDVSRPELVDSAARHGWTITMGNLLSRGAPVGDSLHTAVAESNEKGIAVLLRHGADVNAVQSHGRSPLHHLPAKSIDGAHIAQILIDAGANIHAQDADGNTPLHSLPRNESIDGARIAQVLIDAGANIHALNAKGETPLFYAGGDVVTTLLRAGADPNAISSENATPLQQACENGNISAMKALVMGGADPNFGPGGTSSPIAVLTDPSDYRDEQDRSFLLKAIEEAQRERGKQQLQQMEDKPLGQRIEERRARKQEQDRGRGQGDAEGVAQPDFAKPDSTMSLRDGREALAEVIQRRDPEQAQERADVAKYNSIATEQLRSAIKETIQVEPFFDEQRPDLKNAAGLSDRVTKLLHDGADPDGIPDKRSPLTLLAFHPDRQQAMKAMIPLLKAGADPQRDDILGAVMEVPSGFLSLPTKEQVRQSEPGAELLGMLLETGGGASRPGLLDSAARNGWISTMDDLLRRGAPLGDSLHWAVCASQEKAVDVLLRQGADVNAVDDRDVTPLHWVLADVATVTGDARCADPASLPSPANGARIAQRLIDAGANVNARDMDGETPLLCLVGLKKGAGDDAIKALIRAGADPNVSNLWNETPLQRACQMGNATTVKTLVLGGADPFFAPGRGQSPVVMLTEPSNNMREQTQSNLLAVIEQAQQERIKQQFQQIQAKPLAQRIDEARARRQEQSQGRGQGDAEAVAQPDFAKPEAFYGLGNQINRKRGMGIGR
jgi:ankyrin repeat protein